MQKWIKDLNIRTVSIKFLEKENIEKSLLHTGLDTDLGGIWHQDTSNRNKHEEVSTHQAKTFFTEKEITKK